MKALLIAYDNFSYLHHFPLNLGYIAAVLTKNKVEVEIYHQDINHVDSKELKYYLNNTHFDIVGIGLVAGYYPYKKLLEISKVINSSKNRPYFQYIIGGYMVSANPEYFLEKTGANIIVVGEGEKTIEELVKKDFQQLHTIKGISFNINGSYYHNEKRELIEDLDTLPLPRYDLFPIEVYRLRRMSNSLPTDFVMSVITGRGCLWRCSFCWRMSEGMRLRSIKSIINEIIYLKETYWINYIDFEDDLTMTSPARMTELCEAILDNKLNIKWYCEGRLNFITESLLLLMKKAGCVFINYGIESLNQTVLNNIKKGLTKDIIYKGIELTKKVGISAGLNFLWNNPGDNLDTLNEEVEFLLKYDDCSQLRTIRPCTPYPNCDLYYKAIELGLIKDIDDFYTKHVNSDLLTVNFMDISDKLAYEALYKANNILLDNYYNKQKIVNRNILKSLYIDKNIEFRGFRQ